MEVVTWRTRAATAAALDPFAAPVGRKAWWERRTTQSGVWTLALRGPDGATIIIERADLAIPAGWHADLTVRLSVSLSADANEPKAVSP